jgi:anaerobic magnesium-protoporphyrin IX monomethyl ester cyclase
MRILLVSPKSGAWTSPELLPAGLAYLAASLEQAGHTVQVHDAVTEDDTVEQRLDAAVARGQAYDMVGITAVTPMIHEVWRIATEAHRRGATTVLGGPHATILPEESLARQEVDLVVRGEGEDAVVEIASACAHIAREPKSRDAALATIDGLSFKREDGELVNNPIRPLRGDLDSLPLPAYHLFQVERYSNLQPLTDGRDPHARAFTSLTSRGCPYQCTYCSKSITGRTWRPRSIAGVVHEWAWLTRDLRATEIGLADDVFNLDLERAKELCRALIAEGLTGVPWITIHGMRAHPSDLELFQLMKLAGCKRVGFGVESGNQSILDSIKKQQTVGQVRAAFRNAKRAGLETMGFFMFGLPGETAATMDDTIALAMDLDPDMANFMITAPLPGTELYATVIQDGHLFSTDWTDFAIHDNKARFEIGDLTKELVEAKWHEAYRRFYVRPSRLVRQAFRPDTWRRLPLYLDTARRFFLGGQQKS